MRGARPDKSASSSLSLNLLWPLRLFMGFTFLYAGLQHLTDPSYFDPGKPGYVGNLISQYAVGSPIHNFLLGVAEPNAIAFGYMVGVGESLIGIATLLGFLFRIAAFSGLMLNLTFFLSATWNVFPFYFGSDIIFAACWLTLLLAGPQPRSVDAKLVRHYHSLHWLVSESGQTKPVSNPVPIPIPIGATKTDTIQLPVSENVALYPKQVSEVNKAFDRIRQQFVAHNETQTILEFARAFVISLGVDRNDSPKILNALQNIVNRSPHTSTSRRGGVLD
jgi:thiosulfate dehydrogenase [quinone] large subunit